MTSLVPCSSQMVRVWTVAGLLMAGFHLTVQNTGFGFSRQGSHTTLTSYLIYHTGTKLAPTLKVYPEIHNDIIHINNSA